MIWKMTQSPALLSTHAPPKQFLPGPQFSQLSEEEFTADTNGNDDRTANMFETCNVLFESPQPYEEGKSLPHLADEETPRENQVLWSENRRQKL